MNTSGVGVAVAGISATPAEGAGVAKPPYLVLPDPGGPGMGKGGSVAVMEGR
jgi:hypothetical protein